MIATQSLPDRLRALVQGGLLDGGALKELAATFIQQPEMPRAELDAILFRGATAASLANWLQSYSALVAPFIHGLLDCAAGPTMGCVNCHAGRMKAYARKEHGGYGLAACPVCHGSGIVADPVTLCGDRQRWRDRPPCRNCLNILAWNGSTAPRIAADIYERRAWEDMPILADALEDAGMTATVRCDRGCRHHKTPWTDGFVIDHSDGVSWTMCCHCSGTGRVPHPLLVHLRLKGRACPMCCWKERCDNPEHHYRPQCPDCRGSGTLPLHGRACWALRLILGE